jgi:prevent-host-death family protein
MIDLAQDIHPLSDFKRRTTDFVKRLHESGRPMLLTLNGRPEVVVLDARAFQKLLDELREYQIRELGDKRGDATGDRVVRPLRAE